MELIRIDTLGKLRQACYGLSGWCLDCSALYWKVTPPARAPSAQFDIDLDRLIAERGAHQAWSAKMPLVPCPRCGSKRVELRVAAPDRRAGRFVRPTVRAI